MVSHWCFNFNDSSEYQHFYVRISHLSFLFCKEFLQATRRPLLVFLCKDLCFSYSFIIFFNYKNYLEFTFILCYFLTYFISINIFLGFFINCFMILMFPYIQKPFNWAFGCHIKLSTFKIILIKQFTFRVLFNKGINSDFPFSQQTVPPIINWMLPLVLSYLWWYFQNLEINFYNYFLLIKKKYMNHKNGKYN